MESTRQAKPCLSAGILTRSRWTQAYARAIVRPQTTPFRLLLWHFESLTTPQTFDPFVIHLPAFIAKQPCDQTIAVTTILTGQFYHPFHQA